jgi:hypothetical protein
MGIGLVLVGLAFGGLLHRVLLGSVAVQVSQVSLASSLLFYLFHLLLCISYLNLI